jgi:hypothetical protein
MLAMGNNDKGHVSTIGGQGLNLNLSAGVTACEGVVSGYFD